MPGGYVAAIRAAQLGLSVAVVEKETTDPCLETTLQNQRTSSEHRTVVVRVSTYFTDSHK